MASKDDTNLWLQFFKDAGIPSNVAVKYALTFVENRIKKYMLLDLNKEYLKEMGITLMGDIISILKHARDVYEEDARSNVLRNNACVEVPTTSTVVKKSPAARILEHCIPKPAPVLAPPQKIVKKVVRSSAVAKRAVPKTVVKSRRQTIEDEEQELEPPKKKVRRVLPEHEGKYKVIMPSGTTPRTQKILSNIGSPGGSKKTVFERLGDSTVSSTTNVVPATSRSDQPRITITGITGLGSTMTRPASSAVPSQSSDKINSVFSRLGNKPMGIATQSVRVTENEEVDRPGINLQYAGILKKESPVKKKIIKLTKKNKTSTLKADMQTMQLQERLGMSSLPTPTVAKVLPMRKKIMHHGDGSSDRSPSVRSVANKLVSAKTGVKVRLGSSIISTTTSTTQVVRVNRATPATTAAASSSTKFTRTIKAGNVFARLGR